MTPANSVFAELAKFATDPGSIPEAALHAGRRTLLNAVALTIGAAHHPAVDAARRVVRSLDAPGQATILGTEGQTTASWAAFLGGIAAHVEDFDDTHLEAVVHPGAPVVPSAIAVAEREGASGSELLNAIVIGVEVACRIGLGWGPGHFDRGWHLTSTTGRFGAAAAAARLLGHDADVLQRMWARATVETAGLQAALGTMTKPYHPGKAAYDGVVAADDAARGDLMDPLTAAEEREVGRKVSPDSDLQRAVHGLGERWEIEQNAFKPYACGIVSHPAIDAAISLAPSIAGPVTAVEVTVNPVVLDVMGVENPRTGLESKFSVYHSVAVGLVDGGGGPEQYSDERAVAEEVVAIRNRVSAVTDADMPRDAARLVVHCNELLAVTIDHARGSVARPLTDVELAAKSRLLMRARLDPEPVIDAAFNIGSLTTAELVTAATP